MQYRYLAQEDLYKKFSDLGRKITETSLNKEGAWGLLSNEGMWKLPVPAREGGADLSWKECIAAIEGVAGTCHDPELNSLIITHAGSMYFLLSYGNSCHKKKYLSSLMHGEFCHSDIDQIIKKCHITIQIGFVKFKRLLYGLLASSYILPVVKKIKDVSFKGHHDQFNRVLQGACEGVEKDANACLPLIRSSLVRLGVRDVRG